MHKVFFIAPRFLVVMLSATTDLGNYFIHIFRDASLVLEKL